MIGNILSGANLCTEDKVLILLIKYGRISSREFKTTHRVKNINGAIRNLRKKDFVICSETITDELESGKRVRGTIYYLAPRKYQNNKTNVLIAKFTEEQKKNGL